MSEQIQHMQRLQLAGTVARGIAHDMNNELTLVLGNLEVALDRLPDSFEAFDFLERARTAASRCADMSHQLLTISREKRTVLARMDVAAAIAEARLMLEYVKPPNTRLAAECEAGLFILGDSAEIQQVLINLGNNAFQSMKNGGDLEIRGYLEEGRVNILVKDNGCGMSASLRKRIYEPFFTTHADTGGSGLGLATVRSIMTAHGGLVGLDTIPGEGTTFLLNFPTHVEEPALEPVS
jgi:signal transduction histidine kinase